MKVRSINFHSEELQVLVASFKVLPVALCLTETWGNQVVDTDSHLLNKYQKPLHISRIIKNSGNFMYFHEDYSVKEMPVETTVENLTYKLSRESDHFILLCIYNAPAVGVKNFIADMETILTFLNEYSELPCIVGDMNIDLLKDSPEHRQYMSIVNGNGYTQLINEATRITDKSKTLLDQVLIKKYDEGIVSSGGINTAITDHCATYVELPFLTSIPQAPNWRIMVFLYSKDKSKAFSEKVETFFDNSWQADIKNISDKCSFLISDLNLIIDEFSNIDTPRRKSNSPPWYNNYHRNLITRRKKFYSKYTLDRSTI